jgi:hypothetical protein
MAQETPTPRPPTSASAPAPSSPPSFAGAHGGSSALGRWAWVFASTAPILALLLVAVVLRTLLVERPPTPLPTVAAPLPPLTQHLVLLVMDGLRYDYATDPAKAPHLAKRMAEGPSARVIAGQITMTSAAVLSFGTGARGDFAQVVTNLSVSRTRQNDLFANAHHGGLRTALIGDRTWLDAFGDDGFDVTHTDATGLALDVDNSPEMFAEATKLLHGSTPPGLTVVHFLATDHFGHAFGTSDERYLEMLRRFDENLESFLQSLGPAFTVVGLSDHGATATGAHGSDIWSVRQTPLFAFGPGIRPRTPGLVFEQVDIAATLATLVGVPVPAESRGTVATALLDLTDVQIATLRAAEDRRVAPIVGVVPPGAQGGAVRAYDEAIVRDKESRGLSASLGTFLLLFAGLFLAGAALPELSSWSRRASLRWALGLAATATSSIFLTKYVETIVPPFHNVVRAVLFVAGNAVLLVWALRPDTLLRWIGGAPVLSLAVLPGALAFSYTANTQPEAFLAMALLLVAGLFRAGQPRLAVGSLALCAALHPFGYLNDDPFPQWLANRHALLFGTTLVALLAWGWLTPLARREAVKKRTIFAVLPVVGWVLAERVTPPWGVGLTLLAPLVVLVAIRKREVLLARNVTFASFLLLSREVEVLPVVALLTLAEWAADLVSEPTEEPKSEATALGPDSRAGLALFAHSLVLFGLYFLARVAIQRGLDFDRLHFGAGAFGSPEPNKIWVGVMMGYRYALVGGLLAAVGIHLIPKRFQAFAMFLALVLWFGRGATLCTMLIIGRTSYWTAQRTISDVSPALIVSVVLAVLLAETLRQRRPQTGTPPSSPSSVSLPSSNLLRREIASDLPRSRDPV